MSVIMSGSHQAASSSGPHPESTENTTAEEILEGNSLEDIEVKVKAAIWSGSNKQGKLLAIHVDNSQSGMNRYSIKLIFENSRARDDYRARQQVENEEYKLDPKRTIYQKSGNITPVSVLSIPTVLKLYHCPDVSFLNRIIREAFLQFRLDGCGYTCSLINLFIREGSRTLFEVGLMMEGLKGDLSKEIMQRAQESLYKEAEIRLILENVSVALLYAKQRVRFT